MNHNKLLQASCRVALSGMLHDIGKFAERAKIASAEIENNQVLYCPEKNKAFFTHKHAAYTGIAIDELEKQKLLPDLTGDDVYPFSAWKSKDADDSLINAAAAHHKPNSFLQWLIATADRVASGFERTQFDQYNQTEENKNHYTSRQLTLFEQIHRSGKKDSEDFEYRYPLQPLSPKSIFPIKAQGYEVNNNHQAQAEYLELWNSFVEGLKQIPESHRQDLSLWLDHFDSCWQTFTHAIPSATAFGTKPDISLYDHSKAVAAIAVGLWRYHHDRNDDLAVAKKKMSAKEQTESDWNEKKLLLIQADFFGIQNFIFAHGGDSTKKAAKLLRGRSFYVSLITECAALAVLEALSLPSTSQIINAAGKFLIVAPNTEATKAELQKLQQTFNQWFLAQSYGQSGLGLAWQEACCNDFVGRDKAGFQELMKRLHEKLERSKYQHFDLCGENPAQAVFSDYLDSFNNDLGVCELNNKAPATKQDGLSDLARDQINIGSWLIRQQRLIISRERISNLDALKIPLFDYNVHFVESEGLRGKFGKEVAEGNIRRLFDFSRPENDKSLWHGYARRNISGYVPYFADANEWIEDKYTEFLNPDDLDETTEYQPKTLNHLALEDLWQKNDGWHGIKALAVLKGDIDNLGAMFQNGLEQPTFAKMAALSRQVNNFFAVYLPYLCQTEFPNTYIVFAGGDDFFLLGSWHQLIKLANKLRSEFKRYVVNEQIHFSAGLTVMKPKIPIYQLAEIAEEALEQSKQHDGKNAVTCFKQTVNWDDFAKLTIDYYERLEQLRQDYELSTAYIYGLLRLTEMAADSNKPENALWRSQLYYRTYRTVANKKGLKKEDKKRACEYLVKDIGEQGIQQFKNSYQITLHAHLYTHRKQA
jgi:CRISPR-associated protein Csm1